jgi:hypothetical protein
MTGRTSATIAALLLSLTACGVSTGTQSSGTGTPTGTGTGTGAGTGNGGATPTPVASPSGVAATPTPTPAPTAVATPTPAASTASCSFVWETDYSSVDGTEDFYEVDILQGSWNDKTDAFDGVNAVGYWVSGYDPSSGEITLGAGMATTGNITLSVTGTAMGDPAGFLDTDSQTFYDATDYLEGNSNSLGGIVATGGTGAMTSNLSNPDPTTAVTPGTGTITVTDNSGDTETFADPTLGLPVVAYSVCDSSS